VTDGVHRFGAIPLCRGDGTISGWNSAVRRPALPLIRLWLFPRRRRRLTEQSTRFGGGAATAGDFLTRRFHNGQVDVFDKRPSISVNVSGPFVDPRSESFAHVRASGTSEQDLVATRAGRLMTRSEAAGDGLGS